MALKYEAMKNGNCIGPYDRVGARHTHSMTASVAATHNEIESAPSHHLKKHLHHHDMHNVSHVNAAHHSGHDEHRYVSNHIKPVLKHGAHGHAKVGVTH